MYIIYLKKAVSNILSFSKYIESINQKLKPWNLIIFLKVINLW